MSNEAEKLFKAFEKRDETPVRAHASNNLSFMYFQQGKYSLADKFADLALETDKYNPAALVNKGNCLFDQKLYDDACEFYVQAMKIDATCIEAMYNFSFGQFEMGNYEISAEQLHKLNTILPGQPNVLCGSW